MLDVLALAAVKRGDESALEQIIRKYTPYVTTVIRRIGYGGMNEEDVEEVASDVFFALWKNADKPNPLKLKAYLGQVARNKAKNKLRSLKQELPLEDDWIAREGETFVDGLTLEDERKTVKSAVLSMNEPDREIFLRHYYFLQSVTTIADKMQIGESAVKHRLVRGRLKLKAILVKEGNPDEQENYRHFGLR
jgi:RNA polymerase sigma-70 factor (ECF subfamily)